MATKKQNSVTVRAKNVKMKFEIDVDETKGLLDQVRAIGTPVAVKLADTLTDLLLRSMKGGA